MQLADDESKQNVSIVSKSVVSGEILFSSFEWKIGLDELFVTCLNINGEYKFEKQCKIIRIFLLILV